MQLMQSDKAIRYSILVIRPGAIGDTLLAFPVIQALKSYYTNAHITLVGNPAVLPLAQDFGIADEIFDYGLARWSELFSTEGIQSAVLRTLLQRTDVVICWLRDVDGIVKRNLAAIGTRQVIIAPGRPADHVRMHITDYLAQTVGVAISNSTTLVNRARAHLSNEIAIHPGSGGAPKCWPIASFAAVITALWRRHVPVLLLAGPADTARYSELLRQLGPPPHPGLLKTLVNASLQSVAERLQSCRGYLGNDSGITHLAALLAVPTIALFGPTNPTVWRPLGLSVHVLQHYPLPDLSIDVVMRALETLFVDA